MTPPDSAPPAGIQDAARHLAEGRTDEAAALLERLVRDFPAYVTAHVLLAKAREASGQPERALESWHTAYFLMPGSPLVVRERARLLRAEPARPDPERGGEKAEAAAPSPEPPPETAAPPPPEPPDEPGDVVGTDPTEWVTEDGDAPPAAAPEQDDDGDDWTILEETEASRADGDGVIEPSVAPPPGHPARPPARPAAPAQPEDEPDDLDTLIAQLERAPRIRPDPEFRGDEPDSDADADSDVVSETLAKIYETQKQHAEAARAYERLAAQHPARAEEFSAKAAEMRRRAAESGQA